MDASTASTEDQVASVVARLFSHDAVESNAAINGILAPGAEYRGRGLRLCGASNIKHAFWLLNILNVGQEPSVLRVAWDSASNTATVDVMRRVRPALFPLFQFAVPTRITLSFHPDPDAGLLYCTHVHDHWPLDAVLHTLPLASTLLLLLSNALFALVTHARIYLTHSPPSPALAAGFDRGTHIGTRAITTLAKVAHKPLRTVESVAQATTSIVNVLLPKPLKLPYPSVFDQHEERDEPLAKHTLAAPVQIKAQQAQRIEPESEPQPKAKAEPESSTVPAATAATDSESATSQPQPNPKPRGGGGAKSSRRKKRGGRK